MNERAFLSLAFTYLQCRWQALGHHITDRYGHVVYRGAHDYDSLSFALLGCCDYGAEMRLICKECLSC